MEIIEIKSDMQREKDLLNNSYLLGEDIKAAYRADKNLLINYIYIDFKSNLKGERDILLNDQYLLHFSMLKDQDRCLNDSAKILKNIILGGFLIAAPISPGCYRSLKCNYDVENLKQKAQEVVNNIF